MIMVKRSDSNYIKAVFRINGADPRGWSAEGKTAP